MNSGVENSSIPSKLSFGASALRSAPATGTLSEYPGATLPLPAPRPLDEAFFEDDAIRNSGPRSEAVIVELSLFMGNITYTFPISRSSSALRAENLRPTLRDWEFTRKWFGISSMSSAALVGVKNCRTSPVGKITFTPDLKLAEAVWVERVQEM